MPRYSAYLAEFLGTAILVLGGVGTAVIAGKTVGDLGVALAFGLTLLAMVYTVGPISGAHLNPAVTLGMLVTGKIKALAAAGYVVAQLAGGLGGAALILVIARGRDGYSLAADGLGANAYGPDQAGHFSLTAVLVTEVVLTLLLVFVILATTDRIGNAALAGIPIGLTLAVLHLIAIPIDGTSVNPARSFGPALLTGGTSISQLWVFIVAPLVGALLAAGLYRLTFTTTRPVTELEGVPAA
ncbi:aquaporin [Amycolatopsis sp. H20-H5]|uniref:aquaporin n=1 Tax=Amycolatopsis sp. H20-H5 TaxID=3046309 RepID=UPI002DBAED13|nr:aquaporin [Amycolatopsis sp. H20-H5]MEC3973878.1 aquaporin [Amycolatopsis sp. H20-H5]